jgi:hypothetical protein
VTLRLPVALAAAALSITSPAAAQQTFRDAEAGFSIRVPSAWRPMPDSVLREISSMATRASGSPVHYVGGYQAGGSDRWGELPYVLIQSGQTPPVSEEQFVRMMTGAEGRERIQRTVDRMRPLAPGDIDLSAPTWDEARHVIFLPAHTRAEDGTEIHGLSALRLSRRGFVGIHVYGSRAEELKGSLIPLVESLRFDAGAAYDPAVADRGAKPGTVIGAVVGGLIGLGLMLAFRRRRRRGAGTIHE